MITSNYFYALGRRKSSTARVRIASGTGKISINGQTAEQYFDNSEYLISEIKKPFAVLEKVDQFDISVVINGGGVTGQAHAIRLGVSKALATMNEDLKGTLKRADLLSRDPREKERKKFGLKKARKQRQFTKR